MKVYDHIVLVGLVFFAVLGTIVFSPNPLVFTLLFFAPPALYLVYRKPSVFLPSIPPALIFGLLYGVSFDYLVEINGEWVFPRAAEFTMPQIFLHVVSGDVLVWFILWVFLICVYYEYFLDIRERRRVPRKIVWAIFAGLIPLVVILIKQANNHISYSYAVLDFLALIPVFILAVRRKFKMHRLLWSVPYFALLFFAMEMVALAYGYWDFTGEYIISTSVFGHKLPFEEIAFWILGSPVILIAYHELFTDDER